MPTASDLVTDLPADFEVFGQAVATSMADLLGGTSGQILSKASNTDMDFTWIANDQGDITGVTASSPLTGGGTFGAITVGIQDALTTQKGAVQLSDSTSTTSSILAATPTAVKSAYDLANGAIAKTTVTTAGDIIYRNATVPTRLGIGTAGQVLQVNSGATAPEWATASSGALVKIGSTVSFTTSSAVNVNDVFSTTYKNYKVMLNITSSSATAVNCTYRFRVSGADNSTSNYAMQVLSANDTTVSGGRVTAQNVGYFTDMLNVNSNQEITFFNPFATELSYTTAVGMSSAPTPILQQRFCGFNATTSFTGFSIIPSSGTVTGSLTVYGLVN
jgi:hypothetical protein